MLKYLAHIILSAFTFISLAQFSHAEVWDGLRIYRHDAPNVCAITFDDGPGKFTKKVLKTLKQLNIHATFFVLGIQVEKYPEIIKKIIAEGHEIASHSYSHRNFRKASDAEQYEELNKTNILLKELGTIPNFFRPPYGKYTSTTKRIVNELGLHVILWSSDSRDWNNQPYDYTSIANILGRPFKPKEARGVFLFHDTAKNTVDNLPLIIHELYMDGCRKFVTVSEYVGYSHTAMQQNEAKKLRKINVWQAQGNADEMEEGQDKKFRSEIPNNSLKSRTKYQIPLMRSSSAFVSKH